MASTFSRVFVKQLEILMAIFVFRHFREFNKTPESHTLEWACDN